MVTAYDVAKLLISWQDLDNSDLSNLKLQKLTWYCQGFFSAITGRPLFDDDFEAWEHGPVIPSLYREFKDFGRNPIELDVSKDIERKFTEEELDIIDEVYEVFGKYSAWKLRNMTHDEKPWLDNEARAGLIPFDEIVSYFENRLN
ncbi:hypothetical protein VrSk94_23430 [Vibrio rotiferianus]